MRDVSIFKAKRIKKLQDILLVLETYPDDIKNGAIHSNKIAVYKWLLSYELGWTATTPELYLEAMLNPYNHMYDYQQSKLMFYTAYILFNYCVNKKYKY